MSASGGMPQRVSYDTDASYCAEPDWSRANPDKVAFTMKVGPQYQIGVLDLSKRHGEQVSQGAVRRHRALVAAGRAAPGLHGAHVDHEPDLHPRHGDGQEHAASAPSSFGPALQASVWSR